MAKYCVNINVQPNGDHEVHREDCDFLPSHRKDLGDHGTCRTAVAQAKQYFWQSNGCFFCFRECHSS